MKLVIVESPTKSKTIGKYLGPEYKVMACVGHIRDLDTRGPGGLGIDIKDDFKPTYKIQPDKRQVVKELEEMKKKSSEVILATDPDREGEAIAWHLADVLKLPIPTTTRWMFHEITKNAIEQAEEHPGHIDMDLVRSQETRRIIDRIMGFRLSALLQKKIKSRSAGRVQSVTLRFIVDRENEIKAFVPEEYWVLTGKFGPTDIAAILANFNGKPIKIHNAAEADAVEKALPKEFDVSDVVENAKTREPKPAFTTSTMQQEAFVAFRYSTKKTQTIAQHLYEGKEIEGTPVGLITYMRTDANRVAPEFAKAAEDMIVSRYGAQYKGHTHITTKKSDTVQDAHEAIRPTDINMTPERVKDYLSKDEYNVYRMIYERAVASLMAPRQEKTVTMRFTGNGYTFKVDSTKMVFDGYSKVYGEFENYAKDVALPDVKKGDKITLNSLQKDQKFTSAPSRYTEAKVVHLMEEKGIGRPSTYASTISTLEERAYVESEKGTLIPTEQGDLTVQKLVENFPEFMDASYTANMETSLDEVAEGKAKELDVLKAFYADFSKRFEAAETKMEKIPDKKVGRTCPLCGKDLVERKGRYGTFVACSGYPKCRFVEKPQPVYVEGKVCPLCGGKLVKRVSHLGKEFIGCSNYPKCNYIEGREPKAKTPLVIPADAPLCPRCKKGHLITKHGRFGDFIACSNYPACRYIQKDSKKGKKAGKAVKAEAASAMAAGTATPAAASVSPKAEPESAPNADAPVKADEKKEN